MSGKPDYTKLRFFSLSIEICTCLPQLSQGLRDIVFHGACGNIHLCGDVSDWLVLDPAQLECCLTAFGQVRDSFIQYSEDIREVDQFFVRVIDGGMKLEKMGGVLAADDIVPDVVKNLVLHDSIQVWTQFCHMAKGGATCP